MLILKLKPLLTHFAQLFNLNVMIFETQSKTQKYIISPE